MQDQNNDPNVARRNHAESPKMIICWSPILARHSTKIPFPSLHKGAYRCRVDFKQAPSQIYKLYLEVVGKIFCSIHDATFTSNGLENSIKSIIFWIRGLSLEVYFLCVSSTELN